jgi:hypothetical protein
MVRAISVVLAALLLAQSPRDQPPSHRSAPTATGTIRGRVIAASSGDPIVNAEVSVGGVPDIPRPDGAPERVLTDPSGRYEMTGLAGRFVVAAAKAGYVLSAYGSRRGGDPERTVTIADGATVDGIDLLMRRAAAISGRIVDEFGDPVVSGDVAVSRLRRLDGRLQIQWSRRTQTDDLGEYRVGGLDAGSYLVSLGGGGGTATRWALTYYPGTVARADARALSVQAGDDQSGIDFAVAPAQKQAVHLSGRVIDSTGRPSAATVYLGGGGDRPADSASALTFRIGEAGEFTGTVEPGDTIAIAVGADNQIAMTTFTAVDGDVPALTLALARPGRISGRVRFDGAGAPPLSHIEILAQPPISYLVPSAGYGSLGLAAVRPRADGGFELPNLFGPRVLAVRGLPAGWDVRSIAAGSRDLLDSSVELKAGEELSGVEIVLARSAIIVDGRVIDDAGAEVRDYELLIFPRDPTDQRPRHRRWTRPDQTGRFSVSGLPPGDYLVTAVDAVDDAAWPEEEYVRRFRSRATPFRLTGAGRQTVIVPFESRR